MPEDVNRVVEVGDLNGDGLNDLVYLTEKGTYISLTYDAYSTTNRYHPPVLLSNVVEDITDVVTLDYNKDGAQDLVLLTRDETKPNRIYYGDSRDPEMKNLGEKEHETGVTENGVPGEPVGGLRYAPLGFDGVTYDANGVADEVNGVPATSKFKGTKVVGFDTDGDGVDDSFVVVTDQDDGGGASPEDELYLMGSKTPIKIPGSNTRTTDVVAVRLNNDPNEPVTLIFGKTGTGGAGAVNKYLQIPTQTNDHLIAGDAIEDPLVRYEHMTTFAELLDATNLGKMKYPDPTDPTGVTEVTPTATGLTDWDAAEVRDTHSLKVIEVDDHVYLSGVAAGTTSRVHIYEGFTPAPDAATPTTDTHSGNYYHNPGTPADYPTAGTRSRARHAGVDRRHQDQDRRGHERPRPAAGDRARGDPEGAGQAARRAPAHQGGHQDGAHALPGDGRARLCGAHLRRPRHLAHAQRQHRHRDGHPRRGRHHALGRDRRANVGERRARPQGEPRPAGGRRL